MPTERPQTCCRGDLGRVGTERAILHGWGRPAKHPADPLPFPGLPDRPLCDPNVYFDRGSAQWRMWCVTLTKAAVGAYQHPLTSPTSRDGIVWERPTLGVVHGACSSEANLVYAAEGKAVSGAGVLLDPEDPAPTRRHKLFYCTQTWTPGTGAKHVSDCRVALSADGLHWEPWAGNPVLPIRSDARQGDLP